MNIEEFMNKFQAVAQIERIYDIRRHLNPHHPREDQEYEHMMMQYEQYKMFCNVKDLFYKYKDDLYKQAETDEHFRTLDMLDTLVTADLEKAIFGEDNE
jgi:hypothetical protein